MSKAGEDLVAILRRETQCLCFKTSHGSARAHTHSEADAHAAALVLSCASAVLASLPVSVLFSAYQFHE